MIDIFMMKTMNLWAVNVSTAKCAQRFMVFIMNMSIITECQCLNCKMCSKINGLHHEYVDHYWISVSQLQNVYSWWRPWIFEHILQLRHWDSVMIDIFMMKTMNLWAHFAVETLTFSNDRHIHDEGHESLSTFCSWDKDSWSSSWICRSLLNLSVSTAKCAQIFMVFIMNMSIITESQCLNCKMFMMKTMNLWAHFAVETLRFSNDRHIHDEDHESLSTFCS
jgi:hypothetical protein